MYTLTSSLKRVSFLEGKGKTQLAAGERDIMSKYNVYVGDVSVEAIFNILGGIEGAKRLLCGEVELVEKVVHLLLRLITAAKFDWVNPNITPENFPEEEIRSEDYKVYQFGRDISSEDAVAEMAKDGYLPANIYEFLKWNGWDGENAVVALGSSCVVDGRRRVPFRVRNGARRYLALFRWGGGWSGRCRFLAVRNPQPLVS